MKICHFCIRWTLPKAGGAGIKNRPSRGSTIWSNNFKKNSIRTTQIDLNDSKLFKVDLNQSKIV